MISRNATFSDYFGGRRSRIMPASVVVLVLMSIVRSAVSAAVASAPVLSAPVLLVSPPTAVVGASSPSVFVLVAAPASAAPLPVCATRACVLLPLVRIIAASAFAAAPSAAPAPSALPASLPPSVVAPFSAPRLVSGPRVWLLRLRLPFIRLVVLTPVRRLVEVVPVSVRPLALRP